MLNLLPDVNFGEFVKSYEIQTNDEMAVVYLGSVIRTIIALHNLINNKIHNKQLEETKKEDKKSKDDKEKEKDKKEASEKKEESSKGDKDKPGPSTPSTSKK